MKKVLTSIIFLLLFFVGLNVVNADTINTPQITGVEYPSATSLKVKYNTNNSNSNYSVLLYNITTNEFVKKSITSTNYIFSGLTTGKIYNIKMDRNLFSLRI